MEPTRRMYHSLLNPLRSRGAALSLLGAVAVFTLIGAVGPRQWASAALNSAAFRIMLALLCAGLTAETARRLHRKDFASRRLGSLLLHAGLLAIVIGGAVNARFSREKRIELIEGQEAPLVDDSVTLRLSRLHAFYKPGRFHKGAAAELVFSEDGVEREALVHVNRPAGADGKTILLGLHGFAPLIHIKDRAGRTLLRAYVSLRTEFEKKNRFEDKAHYRRAIAVPGTGRGLNMSFRPAASGGLPTDPRLSVTLTGGAPLRSAQALKPGQTADLGGFRLSFEDVRYWAGFKVRRDPGLPVVFFGFILTLAGAGLCFWRSLWT